MSSVGSSAEDDGNLIGLPLGTLQTDENRTPPLAKTAALAGLLPAITNHYFDRLPQKRSATVAFAWAQR